jgi:hypothetical protein
MIANRITVGVVNWYSTPYILDLIASLKSNVVEDDLEFVICDNTNGKDQQLYGALSRDCEIIPCSPSVPNMWRQERRAGSYAHALGLNELFSQVKTEFCLFVDPDCLMITKGWDVICKSALRDSYIAVGAPYHSRKILKYHSFPSPIFTFFKTQTFREIQADWIPFAQSATIEMRDWVFRVFAAGGGWLGERLWGRSFYTSPVAEKMRQLLGNSSKDTGWQIADKARKVGALARLFTPAVIESQLTNALTTNPAMMRLIDEFEVYLWRGIPLLTHFYNFRYRRRGDITEKRQRWQTLSSTVVDACREIDLRDWLDPT